MSYVPQRGHLIRISFDPQAGHEMGNRLALVMSHTKFNQKKGFAWVCPISNTKRKNPFYVTILQNEVVTGVIMSDQLRSLDYRARQAEFIAECSDDLFEEVLSRIQPILF